MVDTCLDDNMIPAKEVWANCAGYVEVAASKYTTAAHGMLLSVRLNELAKQHGMVWRNDLHEGMEFDRPFASKEVVSPTEDVTKMVIEKQKDEARQLLNATQKDTRDLEKPLDKLAKEIPPEPNLKKDNELANAASIAFILRCDNLSILMLGDSYPQNVERYLREEKGYSEENPLVVDFVKVSHHGSRNNTSNRFTYMLFIRNNEVITYIRLPMFGNTLHTIITIMLNMNVINIPLLSTFSVYERSS